MLTGVQTWRNLSGRWLDAVGILSGVPWCELCAHCLQTFRRGRNLLGRSLDALGASCRAVAVALLCSVLMLADVQTLAQPFGAVVL